MRVLVTGATGFVGRHVVAALVGAGHTVRAFSRGSRPADLPPGVERALGSVTDAAALAAAARGMDAAVHLTAVIVERGEQTFAAVNARGTLEVVRALEGTGVSRLVHFSALGVGPDERFPYLHSKWLGEEAVRTSTLDWTILRPSVLYGEGAGFFRPIVWTLRWMPFYPLPSGGRTRFQPLAVEDVCECVVRALDGAASRASVELGGPDVMDFADIARAVADALGKRRRFVSVPLWAARPFAAVQERRKDPLVTNEQLDMVVVDNTCDPEALPRAFGFRPRRFAETDLRWLARLTG